MLVVKGKMETCLQAVKEARGQVDVLVFGPFDCLLICKHAWSGRVVEVHAQLLLSAAFLKVKRDLSFLVCLVYFLPFPRLTHHSSTKTKHPQTFTPFFEFFPLAI